MKKISLILMLFTSTLLAGSVASVDMNSAFQKYHKTIKAEKKMRAQLALIETRAAELKSKYQSEVALYKQLMQDSADITFDKNVRKEKKEDAEAKRSEIMIMESLMKSFNSDSKKRLKDLHDDSRTDILKEIRAVIKGIAEKNNYDAVLDNSGKTTLLTPVVMVAASKTDITKEVLTILNKGHEQFVADWEREKTGKKDPNKK